MEPNINTCYTPAVVEDAIRSLASQMQNYEFSCIVAPVRGGLVPGVMLSHALSVPLFPLLYSLRDHKAREDVSQSLISYVADNHKKPVLLIDDIVDGGDTILHALDHLQEALPPVVIQVATLIHNVEAPVNVSYSYQQIKRSEFSDWFIFHWEI